MKKFTGILALILVVLLVLPVGAQAIQLIPGGQLIGLELSNETLTVAAFDNDSSPAKTAGLQPGDQITYINDTPVTCAEDIRAALTKSHGTAQLRYLRKGKEHTTDLTPRITRDGPRLGVYLKQGITGVGTVTYYNPENGAFGSLGHSVNDQNGHLTKMTAGTAYDAGILSVKKGQSGQPGQLIGCMKANRIFGVLHKNTPQGVFGATDTPLTEKALPVATPSQVRTGDATIRSTVENNTVQEYSVKILKIYPSDRSGGRNMLIKITDPQLLKTTGGIVQGMSGSPIIQDGKLIGAVTHVLVNDPTTGYGIFIENMLDAAA